MTATPQPAWQPAQQPAWQPAPRMSAGRIVALVFGVLLMIAHDWDDPARWKRSMELLAKEVMPRVADLELAVAAR